MTIYAITDANIGFLTGIYVAKTQEDAIKACAQDVGLIAEIDLKIYVAAVTELQAGALDAWAAAGHKNDNSELSAILDTIDWNTVSDSDVREILGFPARA